MIRPHRWARMCGHREPGHQVGAAQVDAEHEVPDVDRHVLDVGPVGPLRRGRAVHQDVEPAAPGGGGVHQALRVLLDGDVAEQGEGRAAEAGDLLDQRVDAPPAVVGDADDLLAAVEHAGGLLVGHRHGDAGGGEGEGDGAPHPVPLAAAGDQRDPRRQCPAPPE